MLQSMDALLTYMTSGQSTLSGAIVLAAAYVLAAWIRRRRGKGESHGDDQ